MGEERRWTGRDRIHVTAMVLVTIVLTVRRGPFWEAALHTLRYLLVYFFYGLTVVYLFLGLGKKMFKLRPNRVGIVKWAVGLAAFFAVNQALHEAYLALMGKVTP